MHLRDIFHRFLPSRQALYGNRFVNFLGHRLHHPGLWHINRRSAAWAVSIGLFIAFIPLPIHTPLAAICAVALRINLPILILACWATNPLTVVPFSVLAYHTGAWLMQAPPSAAVYPQFRVAGGHREQRLGGAVRRIAGTGRGLRHPGLFYGSGRVALASPATLEDAPAETPRTRGL